MSHNKRTTTYISRDLRFFVALLFILLSPLTLDVEAGSLIEEHLATVCDAKISVVTGALLFEPIPGLDRAALDALDDELVALIESRLTNVGFSESDNSTSSIVLYVDHTWAHPPTEQVALAIDLHLKQRATAFEGIESDQVRPIWASVWSDQGLSLTTISSARQEIVDQSTYAVEHLVGKMLQAHGVMEGNSLAECLP